MESASYSFTLQSGILVILSYIYLFPGAKNFGTTVSPWVVTLEALKPFAEPGPTQNPVALDYLKCKNQDAHCVFNVELTVSIEAGAHSMPTPVCKSNFRYLYWTVAQQIAHHTVTGCNLKPGDLLASGTISGPGRKLWGKLLTL